MISDSVKLFFSNLWDWCKRYWQFIIGALSAVVLFLFFRKRITTSPELVDNLVSTHNSEINIADRSHQLQSELIDRARDRHLESIDNIIEDNNREAASIEIREANRAHNLLRENENNPDEITRRLGDITGIKVVGDNK